jgi:hypothetical protein
MPSFDLPHGTPNGERFSPLDLDRTVIAIPLLKQIQEELKIIEEFNLRFPEAARSHNVAILLSPRDLLQAAFSHNGFSKKKNGYFRSVVDNRRVNGPILIT